MGDTDILFSCIDASKKAHTQLLHGDQSVYRVAEPKLLDAVTDEQLT